MWKLFSSLNLWTRNYITLLGILEKLTILGVFYWQSRKFWPTFQQKQFFTDFLPPSSRLWILFLSSLSTQRLPLLLSALQVRRYRLSDDFSARPLWRIRLATLIALPLSSLYCRIILRVCFAIRSSLSSTIALFLRRNRLWYRLKRCLRQFGRRVFFCEF